MTVALPADEIASRLKEQLPGDAVSAGPDSLMVREDSLVEVATFLKTTPGLDFDYLNNITAVDYRGYFEVVYHLTSLKHNHSLTLKVRCQGRDEPSVPSLYSLWQGADFQEREVYDLMGITFRGHPNLKRLFLWQGFAGHPLRKDYQYDTQD